MEVPDTTKANSKLEGGRHSELLCAWQKSNNGGQRNLKRYLEKARKYGREKKYINNIGVYEEGEYIMFKSTI